jgi:hypothetical protein
MQVDVALDSRTRFPCVRLDGMRDFVSVLPVTKLQVEEWTWRLPARDPEAVAPLLERLSLATDRERFPDAVGRLSRVPVTRLAAETALSVVASNLTHWTTSEETHGSRVTFPTASSEWGRVLSWLSGRVPQGAEWRRTQRDFEDVYTADLLHAIIKIDNVWPRSVRALLWRICELTAPDARGLPFMRDGLYELIGEAEQIQRLIEVQRFEGRPQAAGDCPVWPSLATETGWHPIRGGVLPVVTVRPWFSELGVNYPGERRAPVSINLSEVASSVANPRPLQAAGGRIAERPRALTPYVKSLDRMRLRCPYCHESVPAELFALPSFTCTDEIIEVEEQDGSKVAKRTGKHTHVAGQRGGRVVPRAYLDVVRQHAERVRTVAFAGFTEAGKTTLLLSIGGQMDYPDQFSVIFSAFPPDFAFTKRSLGLFSLRGDDRVDRLGPTERMWIDGILPPRNSTLTRAALDPVLFRTTSSSWWGRTSNEVILIFHDMAGEAIADPAMVDNTNFPHFASIVDAIYVVPAKNLNLAVLPQFVTRLELARQDGVNIDLISSSTAPMRNAICSRAFWLGPLFSRAVATCKSSRPTSTVWSKCISASKTGSIRIREKCSIWSGCSARCGSAVSRRSGLSRCARLKPVTSSSRSRFVRSQSGPLIRSSGC